MRFDTHPGGTPLPVVSHTLPNCPCGHADDLHETVEALAGGEPKLLVICFECDADEEDVCC